MITQFTFVDDAELQLALYGSVSMIFFGGIYYALPRISGRPWAYAGLIRGHLGFSILGILGMIFALAVGGFVQGGALLSEKTSFEEIAALTHPWLVAAMFAKAIVLFGNVLFCANFAATLAGQKEAGAVLFSQPTAMEASAS